MQLLREPALGAHRLQMRRAGGIDAPGQAIEQNHVARCQFGGASGDDAQNPAGHNKRGATERCDRPAMTGIRLDFLFHPILPVLQSANRSRMRAMFPALQSGRERMNMF